jgi:hypothetical protein
MSTDDWAVSGGEERRGGERGKQISMEIQYFQHQTFESKRRIEFYTLRPKI